MLPDIVVALLAAGSGPLQEVRGCTWWLEACEAATLFADGVEMPALHRVTSVTVIFVEEACR